MNKKLPRTGIYDFILYNSKVQYQVLEKFGSKYVKYRKVSNIRRTLVGNKIVDHSDVIGASPVGAAPTTSSFST